MTTDVGRYKSFLVRRFASSRILVSIVAFFYAQCLMNRRQFASCVASGIFGGVACTATGCGTILHPERHGQPHSRDLDWGIVALDALGLLLFFIPGVIAFAVDFSTGAIYLPPDPYAPDFPPSYPHTPPPGSPVVYPNGPVSLRRYPVPRDKLNRDDLEAVVTNYAKRRISLEEPDARVSRLPQVDQFAEQCRQHAVDPQFGQPAKSFLRKWLNA